MQSCKTEVEYENSSVVTQTELHAIMNWMNEMKSMYLVVYTYIKNKNELRGRSSKCIFINYEECTRWRKEKKKVWFCWLKINGLTLVFLYDDGPLRNIQIVEWRVHGWFILHMYCTHTLYETLEKHSFYFIILTQTSMFGSRR